jgi:hypothetical protein
VHSFFYALISLLCLIGLITLGFHIVPRPFRPHAVLPKTASRQPFLNQLPEPVQKHFLATLGENPSQVQSAVVWGRGRVYIQGLWFPMRFKTWYRPGEAYARRMEITWFQRPVFRSWMRWVPKSNAHDDAASHKAKDDPNRIFYLWSEAVWMPSVFVHSPLIQWEAVDSCTARITFPVPRDPQTADTESMDVHFDPLTGRMISLSAYREAPDPLEMLPDSVRMEMGPEEPAEHTKEPWRVDLFEWKKVGECLLPTQIVIAMGESGSPTSYLTIDGVVYNVDVDDQLR